MTQKANYVPNVIFPRFWGVIWSKSGLCFPFFGNEQSLYYLKSTLPGNSRRKRAYAKSWETIVMLDLPKAL